MSDQRPIDVSTGKPRAITDAEVYAEIASKFGHHWEDRKDETIELFVLRDGLTLLGRVFIRGETIRIKVGSQEWLSTIDPTTGESFLDRSPQEQIALYGRVMFCPTSTLAQVADERPEVALSEPPIVRRDPMLENLKRMWEEEDEMAKEPLRWESRHQ